MSKQTIIILWVVAIILVAIIVYFVFFNKKTDKPQFQTNTTAAATQSFNVNSCSLDDDNTLNWNRSISNGSVNCEAARLQKEMNKNITFPYSLLVVDGFFGAKSEAELFRQKGVKSTTLNLYKGFSL